MSALADRDYFTDPFIVKNPYAYFDAVRERAPIYRVPESGVVVVVGHDEALQVLSNTEHYSAVNSASGAGFPLPFEPDGDDLTQQIEANRDRFVAGRELIALDDNHHTFSRAIVSRLFVPSRLNANQGFMAKTADELIQAALAKGKAEFVSEINVPYTTLVIADLLDVPEEDHKFFAEVFRSQDSSNLNQAERDVAVHSLIVLAKYFAPYVQERRNAPRSDVVSELAIANYPDGSKPQEAEIVRLATLLFAAGQDTTAKLLGNGVRYIVEEPGLQDRLRNDPSLIPDFVEEMLRIEGSSKVTARLARKATRLGNLDIPAGTRVMISLAGANRDPRRWSEPNNFELKRPKIKEHLAFSRGAHACVGAQLARTEARVIFDRLLALTSKIDLDEEFHGPPGARTLEYEHNFILRGFAELHLKLTPV